MVKKISVLGFLGRTTKNFNQFKIQKIENICGECGRETTSLKPFGVVYIPRSIGLPEQILINLRKSDTEPGKEKEG